MKEKFYRWYKKTYYFNSRKLSRISSIGKFFIGLLIPAIIFGLNTQRTMIFHILSIITTFILIAFLSSRWFKPKVQISASMPNYGTSGVKFSYSVNIKNCGKKKLEGLFLKENPGDRAPTLQTFLNSPEDKEKARNKFDQRMGYYRWLWLINKKIGTFFDEFEIPTLISGEEKEIKLSFIPNRRGFIRTEGVDIIKYDPFGLFKMIKFEELPRNILILPKRYQIAKFDLPGTAKFQEEGLADAFKVGNSEDFASIREFAPGDSQKQIHWKSFARMQKPMVKEYHEENYSRYALILDTFIPEVESEIFEESVSIASSFLTTEDERDSLIDLMFVGEKRFHFSCGRGVSQISKMLEILACVETCRDQSFKTLIELVKKSSCSFSGIFVILLKLDQNRKSLLSHIRSLDIPFTAVKVSDNIEHDKKLINEMGIKGSVKLISKDNIEKDLISEVNWR